MAASEAADPHAGSNVVPCIEGVGDGVEAVVIPSGLTTWLAEDLPVRAYVAEAKGEDGRAVVALIDTGYRSRLSEEAISTAIAGRRVEAILLTHGHPDHAGGAAHLARRHGGGPVRASAAVLADLGGAEGAPLEEGDRVRFGDRTLVALATPGHTRDHLCFFEEASGLLFTGDTVLGEGSVVVGPPEGHMRSYLETLARLAALEGVRRLLPGHGPPVEEPARKLDALARHRQLRIAQIQAQLASGPRTSSDIVRALYQGEVADHLLVLAEVSVLGSLEWLCEEALAEADGSAYRLKM